MSRRKEEPTPDPPATPTTEKPLPSPDALAILAAQPRFSSEPDAERAIIAALALWREASARNEPPPSDPDTLAMLAAQPRFLRAPDSEKAITAALAFWRGVSVRLDYERRLEQSTYEHYEKPLENLKRPTNWPSTFNDFLRIVVQGKDEAEQMRRLRLWASTWPNDPANANEQEFDVMERRIKEARQIKFTKEIWEANAVSFRRFWKRHTRNARSRAGKRGAEIKAGRKKKP